jgi:hypothetical protein
MHTSFITMKILESIILTKIQRVFNKIFKILTSNLIVFKSLKSSSILILDFLNIFDFTHDQSIKILKF